MHTKIQVAQKNVKPGDKVAVGVGDWREVTRQERVKVKSRLDPSGWCWVNRIKVKTLAGESIPEKTAYAYGDHQADSMVEVIREVAP